ncbi:MAG: AAA family ATPase [Desulfobacterium sp.]|jgi:wobble nucleotide-excising tRNase|nr:AAA family ATPase [Desulfobacterium sp.]MDY0375981.1 AAA family ATPase [Desulfobacterium sp.]
MAIERFNKIRNHRIFSGFVWPQDLLGFKEKNLFYGWNGTGKSTLSNLFRSIEKQMPISEGQVEFVINGNKVDGANIASAQGLPQVRVFNRDFIVGNVFTTHGAVAPIFFLGEENIEKQQQVEKLKGDIDLAEKEGCEKGAEKRRLEKVLDDFKKERAKSVKDLLSSSGGNNPYNKYDKRSYQEKCDELLKFSDAQQIAKALDEPDLDAQKKKKESAPLPKIDILKFNFPLPNIARRLLESFLAFRQPSKSGELRQQLDLIDFDVTKKTRILRFLHTHSHAGQISDPEHGPSILIETKQVLSDLLGLIQKDDCRHFDQMKELVVK